MDYQGGKIMIKDKNGRILEEYDIVEYHDTKEPGTGKHEWVSGPMVEKDGPAGKYQSDEGHYRQFSHGFWQVEWDDSKHGYVLLGIEDNVKHWMREWSFESVTYIRKGKLGESNTSVVLDKKLKV